MKKLLVFGIILCCAAAAGIKAVAAEAPSLIGADCKVWRGYNQSMEDYMKDMGVVQDYDGDFKDRGEWDRQTYIMGLIDAANMTADYFTRNGEEALDSKFSLTFKVGEYRKKLDALCNSEANDDTGIAQLIYDADILLKESEK